MCVLSGRQENEQNSRANGGKRFRCVLADGTGCTGENFKAGLHWQFFVYIYAVLFGDGTGTALVSVWIAGVMAPMIFSGTCRPNGPLGLPPTETNLGDPSAKRYETTGCSTKITKGGYSAGESQ